MARRPFLKRKHTRPTRRKRSGPPTVATLLDLLRHEVVERFARIGMTALQAVAQPVSEPDEDAPAPNPSHPACAEFASSDYCRESWQLHLAQLEGRMDTHWGTCQHGRICAIVPVVVESRCLAVVKLAGPTPVDRSEFGRLMDLLELLVRDFESAHAALLRRTPGGLSRTATTPAAPKSSTGPVAGPLTTHRHVARALDYVAAHLSDPQLSVGHVASVLGICPTYLSELFVAHVGQRMSQFIAAQRIEAAKRLLATTRWQVKQIAVETGHANPNWFCHVFNTQTGLTPSQYRAAVNARRPGRDGQ